MVIIRLPISRNQARKAVAILRREKIPDITFQTFWEGKYLVALNGNGRIVAILNPQKNILTARETVREDLEEQIAHS